MSTTNEEISENIEPSKRRSLIAFPGIKDFYNLLYDRIYMVIDEFFLDHPFTIFINALPRNHESGTNKVIDRYGRFELGYAGITSQKHFTDSMLNEQERDKLVEYWDYLDKVILRTRGDVTEYPDADDPNEQYAQLTSELYKKLRDGQLAIEELGYSELSSYFKDEENFKLKITQCEHAILTTMFDNLDLYYVLSLPLIQFGEVDGVVHLIFHQDDLIRLYFELKEGEEKRKPRRAVGRIIKAISREYEGIMLDWEVEGESYDFKNKAYSRVVDSHVDKDLYARLKENPILDELNYKEYYEKHRLYFKGRFDRALLIPELLNVPYRQAATLSIIIDSFAHNITAHSLTALEWWFRQRSLQDKLGDNIANIQPKWADALLVHEIHKMIRYLQDKGAFWTGLPREQSFGGKVSSLHSMLWHGFASNALLFGTIAFSENILRVNIKVSIIETIDHQELVVFKKRKICTGEFATIDLNEFYTSVKQKQDNRLNPLVKEGKNFDVLSKALKKLKAFFPGSVVGQHAFNTILENELRNVKHYTQNEIEEMRNKGLTLHLSIEEQRLNPELTDKESEYLLMGVWLEHPTAMSIKKIADRLERLKGDILESKTNRALLGGTYQDKICAAYLFNGSFYSTQKQDSLLEQRFFPWIKLGTSLVSAKDDEVYEEVMISARRYFSNAFPASKTLFESKLAGIKQGYFKKFLHLWKGANVYLVDNPDNLGKDFEYPARFRFVNLSQVAPADARTRLRQEGIIRIIKSDTAISLVDAYNIWLKEWLSPHSHYQIQLYRLDDLVGLLEYKNEQIKHYNKATRKALKIEILNPSSPNVQTIQFVHREKESKTAEDIHCVGYRNHGVFKQHFLNYDKLHEAQITEDLAAELVEILATKVLLFDDRIADRLEAIDQKMLKEQLGCEAYREEISQWLLQKQRGFDHFNLLVLHLSFIEKFLDTQGHKMYSENDIKQFLEKEILSNPKVRAKENFLIIITTGRARIHWWAKLKEDNLDDYTSFVTFRPVETILSSIEDAFSIEDDVELKYRLIKVLFGS